MEDPQGMGMGQQPDQQNVYEQAGAESVNMPLAVVGAAVGASLGAIVWFALERYANLQVGYVAVLSGVAAGYGAVFLGKGHGFQVGVLAAVFGVLGVVGGSFGTYLSQKAEAREEIEKVVQTLPAEEQAAARKMVEAELDKIGYVDYVTDDSKYLAFMLLFGAIGCGVGFKTGAGGINIGND